MPESKKDETPSLKDQIAAAAKTADDITQGKLPPLEAFKIPDQVAAAQKALEGVPGADAVKASMDKAAKAAGALKDELAKKLPEPLVKAKGILASLGQEVGESAGGLKPLADALPEVKKPVADASGKLAGLKKSPPSSEKLQATLPNVQDSLKGVQDKIPDLSSQIDVPKKTIEDLTGKLKDVTDKVKPMIEGGPLAAALKKKGTTDQVTGHLKAANEKLPKVPPLLDKAKKKITDAAAPLAQAGKTLADVQAKAVPSAPPPSKAAVQDAHKQIKQTSDAVNKAAAPVQAAAKNVPQSQEKVAKAQELAKTVKPEMKPAELTQAMKQISELVKDAQKEVAEPAAGMGESAKQTAPLQEELTSVQAAASATLPGAAAAVPPEEQAKAAELLAHAQESLDQAPTQMAEAAPLVQQLSEQLPKVEAPISQAAQAMHDALEQPQKDLAQLEEELRQAEEQMALLTKQVDDRAQTIQESEKKLEGAMALEDPAALSKMLDEILAGLSTLDDQSISDFEKRLPELEALIQKIEQSGNGSAA